MERRGALFLGLCLVTAGSGTADASGESLRWMQRMEAAARSRRPTSPPEFIHGLEQRLLNATFGGHNLTLQTRTIQSLAFRLGCDFAGLSLSSSIMEWVPQSDTNASLLNNYVLGAQLGHEHVNNLREPINISFWHNQSLEGYMVTCVFWKEGASQHYWGVWSPEGCRTEQPSPSQVLCRCNHLSYFAVLMQLSAAPVPVELLAPLTYISLVGCSISVMASLLTLLLHVHTRRQRDSITRIHMNLHASVLLLNVAFLLSPTLAVTPVPGSVCAALAAVLHFALLSCLTWMAIEGFNLYLLLGRVYNIYIRRYVLKLCAVGWGVPAFLVLLVLAVKSSAYGPRTILLSDSQGNGTSFQNMSMCWVRSPEVHSVLVMGYGGLTSLFNLVVLAWALRALRRLKAREKAPGPRACRDTVTVLGLTVLLGTTWALAFFSFGVFLLPQLFLFTVFNSLYGFFLFLWFCSRRCRSEAVAEAEMEAFSSAQTVS
ncbi:adhesion G-protein coupled receptor G5 isoform X2 [Equus caballus]|uniref:Adhesion G protein-coupled receptor G5 n=1 Tax=Equus caballus TaxID=9796 RepID=F6TIA2_HORSE|nr:adhesion G-protein coupled receptor G5 isoform X2 [Equus caballus]